MSNPRLRIAHVGLGDIARKAYLPLTSAHPEIAPALCTRDEKTLAALSRKYRIGDVFSDLDDLIASRPDAAMIHAATEGHLSIARPLLEAGIPLTDLRNSEKITHTVLNGRVYDAKTLNEVRARTRERGKLWLEQADSGNNWPAYQRGFGVAGEHCACRGHN